ncbi:PQQ-dependent sugar dehydrogenase [Bacillus paralicheniformis]|uniref:PQQ-dependent sugar dehydrogenase n=1 Tax=Bacillus paralicheniformis TaxID=1648923 RepID=UPI00128B399B|nr:PQQ-dependent sugar dehydrogenase [Bacillus paralicheniformis]MPQ25408.1 glucose dehydrogenase [Bacillus paralicheniformis]
MKKGFLMLIMLFFLGACTEDRDFDGENEAAAAKEGGSGAEVIAERLDVPWTIAHTGEIFYITERNGGIVSITDGKKERMQLQLKKPVHQEGEGGLLGFVLHPDFKNNQEAYVYHTYKDGSHLKNRIVKLTLDRLTWTETEELLADLPGGVIHNGGRMAIGPDQKLYITTGDAGEREWAQQPEKLAGAILRMELDGAIPADQPFRSSYVYSFGHRNPQGLAWLGRQLYSSEHGQSGHDEVNKIEPGANYGWPVIEGSDKKRGMKVPLIHSGEKTWAPSGLAQKGDILYMAGLQGEGVFRVDPAEAKAVKWLGGYGRIRDVKVIGNDLYFITNNGDGRGEKKQTDDRLIRVPLSDQ